MILLPGCECCCPCGAATLPFPENTAVTVTITFANAQSVDVCMSEPGTLTLNSAELCEYSADYEVSGVGATSPCTVRIYYIVNGPGCSYIVNGWGTGCTVGVNAVTITGTPCE